MESKLEKLVLELYDIEVVKFGSFKLKSGVLSPVYFDLRIIVSYPDLMDLLTTLLVDLIQNCVTKKFEHVCGVPYTALPMATLVSNKSKIPMLIRRREVKDHGTRKIIEGKFRKGDECIVIEDVVSSGSSILETVKDLSSEGLNTSHAIVVLDREQGGVKNLQDQNLKVHVLISLSEMLEILFKNQKISQQTVSEVKNYISSVSLLNSGKNKELINDGIPKNRLQLKFSDRAKLAKNKVAKKVFEVIELKKSLLCVAADVTNTAQLLKLVSQVGPHICILKTHFDALEDFSSHTCYELMKLSGEYNFLIMEDRKFADIGNTVCLQFNQIKTWADIITTHSISGEAILTSFKSCVDGEDEKGCFIVAELSCQGNLISKDYSMATVKMAEDHADFVIGLVCQSPELVKVPYLIQLCPGVKVDEGSDGLGQNYNSPEYVVLKKGADIAVVGRGVINSSDPEKTAIMYKEKLWNAYQMRIAANES